MNAAGGAVGAEPGRADDGSRFDDSECLRRVLVRLHTAGRGAWRTDPEAEALVRHARRRFAALARKCGLEDDDGASAAFEAMTTSSARYAADPWAVIVRATAATLRAWQFADEALCSIETARRGGLSGRRAERFSERDPEVWERRPELAQPADSDLDDDGGGGLSVHEQAARLAALFAGFGWPLATAWTAIEVVMRRLAEAGSRPACLERLRKDRHARAISDLPAKSWNALLRVLLGDPRPEKALTDRGRGVLLRVALGESVEDLAADPWLARLAAASAPRLTQGR